MGISRRGDLPLKTLYAYDFTVRGFWDYTLPGVFVVAWFCIGAFAIWFSGRKKEQKTYDNWKIAVVICIVAVCFGGLMAVLGWSHYAQAKQQMESVGIQTAEGYVENLQTVDRGNDSFTLNGVTFDYGTYDWTYGLGYYHRNANHGGAITQNGQHLRITYLHLKGRNAILSIEEYPNDEDIPSV